MTSADVKNGEEEIHDLDSLFKPLGGFGRFQLFNMVSITSIICLCTFSELGYVMTAAELKHRCLISECENDTARFDGDVSFPFLSSAIPRTSSGEYDSCLRFSYNESSNTDQCSNSSFNHDTYRCQQFVYETEEWTIHREDWGIHCDSERYLLGLVGSLNNAGQVFAGMYAGYLQDRFGRKTALVSMTLVVAVVGIIKSFSVNYYMMVALEVLESQAAVGLFNGPFVLAVEIVAPSQRVLAGTTLALAYPTGGMIIGLVQFLTFNWRNTLRICYAPFLLCLSYYWLLPESARWLLNQKRYDDAVAVINKMASMNGTQLPENAVKNILITESTKQDGEEMSGNNSKSKFKDVARSRILRWRVLGNILTRMTVLFVYFGMTLNSVSLSEDKFLNFILTTLIELPGYITVFFLMNRIGRKPSLLSHLLLCGVACIISAFIPPDWGVAKLVLFLIGKFGASGGLFVSDIYTAEMFPTFIRSTMLSVSVLMGKLACVVAPQVPLLADIYAPLPLLIFGTAAFIGGSVVMIFPETLNTKLPDTIDEAENLGK